MKILLLIINVIGIYNIIFNNDFTVIYACGLFGFIGNDPKTYFSWDKFNILGYINDKRGGDSCGRIFNNMCQKGVNTLSTYSAFGQTIKNPKEEITGNTVLGHCRKASSGGKLDIYAQPVILTKKDINTKAIKNTQLKKAIKDIKNDDQLIFSGIHNGTISDYTKIANKYGIPSVDYNDSKTLLEVLFYGYYEILSEYTGTASLVWHNHISNKTYMFRGESKYYSYSTIISEERPLFYWQISKDNIYFSSIEESLKFINADDNDLHKVEANKLYIFKNGVLIEKIPYDRKDAMQDTYTYKQNDTKYKNNSFGGLFGRHNIDYYHSEFPIRSHVPVNTKQSTKFNNNPSADSIFDKNKNFYVRLFDVDEPVRWQAEIVSNTYDHTRKTAFYNKGRYWMNGGLMHGVYVLTPTGVVPSLEMTKTISCKCYFFIEGILISNIQGFNKAKEIHKSTMLSIIQDPTKIEWDEQKFVQKMLPYAKYPIATLLQTSGIQDCYDVFSTNESVNQYFTGVVNAVFSPKNYRFDKGDLKAITYRSESGTYNNTIAMHYKDDEVIVKCYIEDCNLKITNGTSSQKEHMESMVGYNLMVSKELNKLSPLQNMILANSYFNNSQNNVDLFTIHFLRDFDTDLKKSCFVCENKQSTLKEYCLDCKLLLKSNNFFNEIDYETYNRYD